MDFSDWIDVFNFGMDRVQVLEMKRTSGLHRDWDPESGAPYIYISSELSVMPLSSIISALPPF